MAMTERGASATSHGRWESLEPRARFAGLLLFGVALVASAAASRVLFADGAAFFIAMLREGGTVDIWWERAFLLRFTQLPAALAIKLGVTDLALLSVIYSLGCFLPWVIALWFCDRLAPRWLWVVLLATAVGFLNTSIILVGEHGPTHAFFWPAAFALLFARPLTPFAAVALLASAALLVRSYETMLFLGPPLAALAGWRLWREGGWRRAVLLLAAALFLAGGAIALGAVLAPRSSSNFGDFRAGAVDMLLAPSTQLVWCALWLAAMGLLLWRPRLLDPLPGWLLLAALLAVALLWAAQPFYDAGGPRPELHHRYRAVNLAVPLGLLAALLLARRRPLALARARAGLATLAATALAIQSLWTLAATLQWWGYLGVVRGVLESRDGLVDRQDTPLAQARLGSQALGFTWSWTLPDLSLALADGGVVRTLLFDSQSRYIPWHPADPAALPQLEAYGVDYGPYLQALEAAGDRLP